MKLAIILPAHNEEPNIRRMVEGLLTQYDQHILELIVVDDASADRTATVVEALAATDARVRVIRRQPPCGVGRALKDGFLAVSDRAEYVLMMDADFVDNIDDVARLMSKINEGYDGVVGSRFVGGMRLIDYPWAKLVANRAFHGIARLVLGITQHDLTNNFKLYRAEIVKRIPWHNHTFAINAETGLFPLLRGYRIAEVPVAWVGRAKGMGLSDFSILRVGPHYLAVLWMACCLKWSRAGERTRTASL